MDDKRKRPSRSRFFASRHCEKREETGGEGPAIRETCEALSTALHAIPLFLFLLFVFPRSRVSLDHYVLFYVPTSCSTYLLQSGTWCRRVDARIIWGTELTLLGTELN